MEDKLEKVIQWIRESKKIYFFTGAGMSAASGISTFRGSYGLWVLGFYFLMISTCIFSIFGVVLYFFVKISLFKILLFSVPPCFLSLVLPLIGVRMLAFGDGWKRFPKINWILFKIFFFDKVAKAKLNDGHKFMRYLKECGKQVIVVTGNVDGLETQVSSDIDQVHGNIENIFCSYCRKKQSYRLNIHKSLSWLPPKCEKCNRRNVRTGCLLFRDLRNPFFSIFDFKKDAFYPKSREICFVIGTSGKVDFGLGRIQDSAIVVEINPTDKTLKSLLYDDYLYFQNPQEMILKRLHNKILK